jgi:hypothetical protein
VRQAVQVLRQEVSAGNLWAVKLLDANRGAEGGLGLNFTEEWKLMEGVALRGKGGGVHL